MNEEIAEVDKLVKVFLSTYFYTYETGDMNPLWLHIFFFFSPAITACVIYQRTCLYLHFPVVYLNHLLVTYIAFCLLSWAGNALFPVPALPLYLPEAPLLLLLPLICNTLNGYIQNRNIASLPGTFFLRYLFG